jgi:hypothetical protein
MVRLQARLSAHVETLRTSHAIGRATTLVMVVACGWRCGFSVPLERRACSPHAMPSSLAVALTSPLARRFEARLDGTEHGATLKQVGASSGPVPASYASGAGARPGHSITRDQRVFR